MLPAFRGHNWLVFLMIYTIILDGNPCFLGLLCFICSHFSERWLKWWPGETKTMRALLQHSNCMPYLYVLLELVLSAVTSSGQRQWWKQGLPHPRIFPRNHISHLEFPRQKARHFQLAKIIHTLERDCSHFCITITSSHELYNFGYSEQLNGTHTQKHSDKHIFKWKWTWCTNSHFPLAALYLYCSVLP